MHRIHSSGVCRHLLLSRDSVKHPLTVRITVAVLCNMTLMRIFGNYPLGGGDVQGGGGGLTGGRGYAYAAMFGSYLLLDRSGELGLGQPPAHSPSPSPNPSASPKPTRTRGSAVTWRLTRTVPSGSRGHPRHSCAYHAPSETLAGAWRPPGYSGGVFAQRAHSANYYGDYPGNNPENHLRNHAQSIQNSKIQTSNACHGSQGPKFCPL